MTTGSKRKIRESSIREGFAKDRFFNDVYGIACIGNASKVGNEKEYNLWRNMLSRCYVKTDNHYDSYGGLGISVCEEWQCFEKFSKDIPNIDGYDEKNYRDGNLVLDKDKKQFGVDKSKMVYSLDTCVFISNFENVSMVDRTNQKRDCIVNAIAVDGIGNVYFINKIPVFVDDMNLRKSGVYHCLRGTKKTHNKFKFRYATEEESIKYNDKTEKGWMIIDENF